MKPGCRWPDGLPFSPLPSIFQVLILFLAASLSTAALGEEAADTPGPMLGSASSDAGQPDDSSTPAESSQSTDDGKPTETSHPDDATPPSGESKSSRTSEAKVEQAPYLLGEPLAPGIVELLQQEIMAGLKRRRIDGNFYRFRSYAGSRLNATARRSGSELTGNCRLKWYDHMLRNPLKAPAEAEAFTRKLHKAVLGDHRGLAEALAMAAAKLDLKTGAVPDFEEVTSPQQALETIKEALTDSQLAYCAALEPLSKQEIRDLSTNLYPILTGQNRVGHTLQSRGTGRRLCDLMEKMDRSAMLAAAEALVPIADPQLLQQLKLVSAEENVIVEGTTGTMIRRIDTPSGAIVIGGAGTNTYKLDKMPGVNVVIDLGGNDTYYEGGVSPMRPVLIVIDLGGDDGYTARRAGAQGGGLLGVSMLLELEGNDVYKAGDVAQGSCLAGVGILIDYAGDDAYIGLRRVQGEALGGVGMLIDRAGDDRYHAALWAQGMGGPLGFGLLDDLDGKDHYYCGGMYINSYIDDEDNPTPGYEGWGQGVGGGLRSVTSGGIGVILDGGGDDVYEYDYLSHGGGYWAGMGFARDFGGNDQRLGATRKAYNGGPRTQRRFVRFSGGFGCHYALGFLFDDRGNDTYNGTIMSVGYAWDCAVGYLCDFSGNDRYSGNQGNAAQAGLAAMFDYDGNDVYKGYRQGRASSGISYHDLPMCGGNFSFTVDYGGTDKYGSGARNNSYLTRSSSGGFLIDRPKQKPVEKTAKKTPTKTTAGS